MYLLDTNVLSELPKRKADGAVVRWVAAQREVALSVVTVEELAFGVARAKPEQAGRLQEWFDRLLAIPPAILPVDDAIALAAGRLRAAQERAGRVASQADMLIAATALRTGRILVTRNVKDFQDCGVPLLNPFSNQRHG
jgi:predicted nucleic acid-binding protein